MKLLGDTKVRAKQQQLAQHVAKFKQATKQKDAETLSRIVADEFTLVDPTGNVKDKERMLGDITSGRISFKSYRLSQETLTIRGNAAVATGVFSMNGSLKRRSKAGKVANVKINGKYRQTNTYYQKGAEWVLVACHLTRVSNQRGI